VEIVDALELAALKRLPEGAFENRRHLVNIVSAVCGGASRAANRLGCHH
jgi:hypothetical protein